MKFKFACPKCSKRLAANELLVGQSVSCPHCKTKIEVPDFPALREFLVTESARLDKREASLARDLDLLAEQETHLSKKTRLIEKLQSDTQSVKQELEAKETRLRDDAEALKSQGDDLISRESELSSSYDAQLHKKNELVAWSNSLKDLQAEIVEKGLQVKAEEERVQQIEKKQNERSVEQAERLRKLKLLEQSLLSKEETVKQTIDSGIAAGISRFKQQFNQQIAELDKRSNTINQLNELVRKHERTIERLKIRNQSLETIEEVPTYSLPFDLLPPGSWDIDDVIKHYKREASNFSGELQGATIDWERLRDIKRLRPQKCYIGRDMWLGYVVFTFANTSKVILECPIEGNAIYIIKSTWQEKVRHTKKYLRENHPKDYTKIVHKGDWLERVTDALI